jgi:hypothetical protein
VSEPEIKGEPYGRVWRVVMDDGSVGLIIQNPNDPDHYHAIRYGPHPWPPQSFDEAVEAMKRL